MPLLFSYGTLQQAEVQLATLGRRIDGRPGAVIGCAAATVPVTDLELAERHGMSFTANLRFTGRDADHVTGTVFEVTEADLALFDGYESPFSYQRLPARLAGGGSAWVYVHVGSPQAGD